MSENNVVALLVVSVLMLPGCAEPDRLAPSTEGESTTRSLSRIALQAPPLAFSD